MLGMLVDKLLENVSRWRGDDDVSVWGSARRGLAGPSNALVCASSYVGAMRS
jgi:hypothetical protein